MNDLTLAIVTSTPQVSVALGRGQELLATISVRMGRRHAEVLAPAIESATRLAGITLDQVGRVAVDAGPGLFTGLRVGVATAKALASGLQVLVVTRSSLELLAHPHRRDGRPVASVVDARRGEVFWSLFRPGAGEMEAVTEASVSEPGELARALADLATPALVTGDGARRYAGELPGVSLAGPEHDHPSAQALLELACGRRGLPPERVQATYLRGADVRIGWEQRHG